MARHSSSMVAYFDSVGDNEREPHWMILGWLDAEYCNIMNPMPCSLEASVRTTVCRLGLKGLSNMGPVSNVLMCLKVASCSGSQVKDVFL